MARPKKSSAGVPEPKDPTTVKNGCVSCTHYRLEKTAFPCRNCENWNYWEDSNPKKEHYS